jgi:hypothetical protein
MADTARGFGFALEPRHHVGLSRVLGVQHFHRETLVAETGVARLVHPPHAPFADDAHDLVGVPQGRTQQRVRSVVGRVDQR